MKYTKVQKKLLLELVELTIKKANYRKEENLSYSAHVDLLILKKKREMEIAGVRFFDSAIRVSDDTVDSQRINDFINEYLADNKDGMLYIDKSYDFEKTKAYCFYTNTNDLGDIARLIEDKFSTSKIENDHIDKLSMDHWFVPEFLRNCTLAELRDELRG